MIPEPYSPDALLGVYALDAETSPEQELGGTRL